jgi:hypothetical protein
MTGSELVSLLVKPKGLFGESCPHSVRFMPNNHVNGVGIESFCGVNYMLE